jgi:hypothetical protein
VELVTRERLMVARTSRIVSACSVPTNWLHSLTPEELRDWTVKAVTILTRTRNNIAMTREWSYIAYADSRFVRDRKKFSWAATWPEYSEPRGRLVGSFEGVSLLCLKGLALQPISTAGFVGVIDVDSVSPDISRRQALDADVSDSEYVNDFETPWFRN